MVDVILGLSVNARMLGLAVISENEIVYFDIQKRDGAWTSRKKEMILASVESRCRHYNIKNIALSIPYDNQISSQTSELLESLKKHFNKNNISFFIYSPRSLNAVYQKQKTKKEIMRELASQHIELVYYYKMEMKNKHKYYIKLFDAVEVGKIHFRRIKGKLR